MSRDTTQDRELFLFCILMLCNMHVNAEIHADDKYNLFLQAMMFVHVDSRELRHAGQ